MKYGLNKATLAGNLGADPELKFTQNNTAVLKLRLATTESVPKGGDGQREDVTHWHSVVLYGKRAEALAKILHKGSAVLVEGRIETRSYEKDGEKKWFTEIAAFNLILLDSKGDSSGDRDRGNDTRGNANRGSSNQSKPANGNNAAKGGRSGAPSFDDDFGGGGGGSDDDIPFDRIRIEA